MTNDELLSRYFLSRQLWWQHTLAQLDAQAVADIIKTLEAVQRDIRKRLADDAEGLAQVTDWTRERMQQVEAWTDEVLASARGTLLTTINEATITAATVSLAAHNAILSLDGTATGVQTVGLTREQIVAWFDDTALGAGGLKKWVDTALDNGVKSSILQALRKAGVEGEGTAEAVRRVMSAALDAGFNITQREAITITRTFIQTANVRAQEQTYEANVRLLRGYKRVETLDNRTCIQCFTGGTEVSPLGKILGVSKREYVGDVVIITTATGKKLEGTPNHPILTPDGWLPLDKVKPNQKVINAEFLKAGSFAGANDVCVPTSFSELYDSFSSLTTCKVSVVRASPEDFHGDGMGSNEDVNVHCSILLLRDDVIDSSVDELSVDDKLTTIKMPAPFLAKCELLKLLFASFESLGLTSKFTPKVFQDGVNPALRTLESFADFLGANSAVEHCKRPLCGNLAGTSTLIPFDILHDFEVNKEFGNSGSGNAIFDSKFASGDSASVFVDNVVSVKRETRTCHVYNLQSCLGVYIAGGIIVKNCALSDGAEYAVDEERPRLPSHARCRGMYTPLVKSWKDLGISGPDLEEAARPWVMREPGPIGTGGRKILYAGTTKASFEGWWKSLSAEEKAMTPLGPVRTKLLESGAVKWDDLWDKRTGLPKTLEQVGFDLRGRPL